MSRHERIIAVEVRYLIQVEDDDAGIIAQIPSKKVDLVFESNFDQTLRDVVDRTEREARKQS